MSALRCLLVLVIALVVWVYGAGIAVAQPTLYYVYTDQLNTPRTVTNTAATPIWKWENLDPYGANAPNQDPDGDTIQFVFNLRFPGQYFDRETGTYYNFFRDYDPGQGRYIESDPIGLQGGINTYAYVDGNPVRYADPLGLSTEIIIWNPVGIGESSYGHVSTNINGANYSWGPGGWDTRYPSAADYNARQAEFRGGSGVRLNLNPRQEAGLAACLKSSARPYNALSNNCGAPIQICLDKVGAGVGKSMLPSNLLDNLRNSPNAGGNTSYPDPRGSNGFGSGMFWR